MNIPSPITSGSTKKLKVIKVQSLVSQYKNQLGIDVSKFFKNLDELFLLNCHDTGYKFFYPFHVFGDNEFYEQLESFNWYYMPWKWEHEKIRRTLKGDERILEIGSGGLGFLSKMDKDGFKVTGLELNENSLNKAKSLNLDLRMETIQKFSSVNNSKFDVVCSFQVLEHISDVTSFIKAQLNCLKTAGSLVISVPNNASFIKYDEKGILNQPPHHMGLWDENSLRKLEMNFNLKVEKVYFEPLQKYHVEWYRDILIKNKFNSNTLFYKVVNTVYFKYFLKVIINFFRPFIKGHSILVIYSKVK